MSLSSVTTPLPMHVVQRLLVGLLPWGILFSVTYAYPWVGLALLCAAFLVLVFGGFLLSGLGRQQCQTPIEHQVPLTDHLETKMVTYFYPGLGGSWMQALRYAGPGGFPSLGARIVVADFTTSFPPHVLNAPLLFYSLYLTNPPEVVPADSMGTLLARPMSLLWCYTGVLTSIGSACHNISWPMDYVLEVPLTSFAQHDDIHQFLTAFRESRNNPAMVGRTVVLAGTSRGASTILGAVVHMTPEEQASIGLVLLEGAFDTVPNVAAFRFGTFLGRLVPWLLSWTTRYDPSYPSPLELARRFPPNVPVAIVTSEADNVVPMKSTLALQQAVLAARNGNEEHVHTLILKTSQHSSYSTGNLPDQTSYRAFVDDLYRKYVK